jgi:hypothetical protein
MVEVRLLSYATIHQQPFPVLHYCGMGDLPSVALEAQTNEGQLGQSQGYRLDGLKNRVLNINVTG